MARLRAAAEAAKTLDPSLASRIPDPADLLAAGQGDRAAVSRLNAFYGRAARSRTPPQASQQSATQASGISSVSFLSFHPPLTRRLKRLDRMGAHLALRAAKPKTGLFVFVLSLILAPLFLLVITLFLFLIAVMTLASLAFVLLWLAVIHKIFVLVANRQSS